MRVAKPGIPVVQVECKEVRRCWFGPWTLSWWRAMNGSVKFVRWERMSALDACYDDGEGRRCVFFFELHKKKLKGPVSVPLSSGPVGILEDPDKE